MSRFLLSPEKVNRCRGGMTLSLGFYLGTAALILLLVVGAVVFPAPVPLTDQHAAPAPATGLPADVLIFPGSNLYHGGASCRYTHRGSRFLATSEAVQQGLVPCPYCIGNSSARLVPPH
jgi:hypothetical protein